MDIQTQQCIGKRDIEASSRLVLCLDMASWLQSISHPHFTTFYSFAYLVLISMLLNTQQSQSRDPILDQQANCKVAIQHQLTNKMGPKRTILSLPRDYFGIYCLIKQTAMGLQYEKG